MPTLSQKRQITLPKELCDRLFVQPGDDLSFLEHEGRITIIKKAKGSSEGKLRHLKGDVRYSENDSLQDAISEKRGTVSQKKQAA